MFGFALFLAWPNQREFTTRTISKGCNCSLFHQQQSHQSTVVCSCVLEFRFLKWQLGKFWKFGRRFRSLACISTSQMEFNTCSGVYKVVIFLGGNWWSQCRVAHNISAPHCCCQISLALPVVTLILKFSTVHEHSGFVLCSQWHFEWVQSCRWYVLIECSILDRFRSAEATLKPVQRSEWLALTSFFCKIQLTAMLRDQSIAQTVTLKLVQRSE